MPPKPWKTLKTRVVYKNPWTLVREDIAEMPNGKTTIYGVVECNHCVGVLPFLDEDRVLMVRQYRYVFGENHRWEMPTGGVKEGESFIEAAQRELEEEAGYTAADLLPISTYYPSKSIVQEVAHLYIGHNLKKVKQIPDETEHLEVADFPFKQIYEMVIDSEIRDSMTVIAVLLAAQHRRQ